MDNATGSNASVALTIDTVPLVAISCMFCVVGVVGIVGNSLVIVVVLTDKKMRHSVTNLFIVNLAVSDLLIMVVGVPDIAQFMLNRGWLLGAVFCRLERYVLVFSLYASVLSLVAVCIERYIAIIHPMTAHIYCSRGRIQTVIAVIWPCVLVLALPIALFNTLVAPHPRSTQRYCFLRFPGDHLRYFVPYKYAEFALFYLLPVALQVGCYAVIARRLFASTKQLRAPSGGGSRDLAAQRKGVVKMLIACVAIYVVSYSPHQALLVYRTFAPGPVRHSWTFLVLVTAMAYVNSATNPVLYCVFSATYRAKFRAIFCFARRRRARQGREEGGAGKAGDVPWQSDSGVSTKYVSLSVKTGSRSTAF